MNNHLEKVHVTVSDLQRVSVDDPRNELFFAAVSKTRMPMTVTDPHLSDNPIIYANPAFLEMTGYDAHEIVGKNCRFLQGPETSRETLSEIRAAIEARQEFATEVINYRKNGSTFWNALFISPVFDSAGNIRYFFGSQLDVSRRRDAEDALRQSQKMEALGQLTGGIAHDFNNLLQVISGYLDLIRLQTRSGNLSANGIANAVERSTAAVDKATTLTQQLLSFARKQSLMGRTVNLNTVGQSIIELARQTLGESVKLTTSFASDLPNCELDPTQLELALLNLLINARDAMSEKQDKHVSIVTEYVELELPDQHNFAQLLPGQYASIAITDTGKGISEGDLPRVMEPFYTTKEEGKGTGLGLSMVYGFAKQSGGGVNLYSEVGIGTTIKLYFPISKSAEMKAAARAPRASEDGGSETILIVDDRIEVAKVASEMLTALGYVTLVVSDPRDAIKMLQDASRHVDLLFTDLIMPGAVNGVMLAREARRYRSNIKILLTTGYSSLERKDEGGIEFDLIQKPYRQQELARKVRIVLNGPNGVG